MFRDSVFHHPSGVFVMFFQMWAFGCIMIRRVHSQTIHVLPLCVVSSDMRVIFDASDI